ncbi:MAG: hypothetical protein IKN04_18850 [Clostridia bacterium]|nr:hypothetical protein [Clostridia bacterium]
MTDAQQREAARQFFYRWNGKGREDEDARSYWIEILTNIIGVDRVTERVDFEKKVIGPLFPDDLKAELEKIKQIAVAKTQEKRLRDLRDKLAGLSWLESKTLYLIQFYDCPLRGVA